MNSGVPPWARVDIIRTQPTARRPRPNDLILTAVLPRAPEQPGVTRWCHPFDQQWLLSPYECWPPPLTRVPPALAIGGSNLWPPVGQNPTSAQAKPRPSSPPEPGARWSRDNLEVAALEVLEVMPGRGCSSDCGSDGGADGCSLRGPLQKISQEPLQRHILKRCHSCGLFFHRPSDHLWAYIYTRHTRHPSFQPLQMIHKYKYK